jgi:competence protein ComEA
MVTAAVLGVAGLAGVWVGVPSAEPPPVAIARSEPVGAAESTATTSITVHVAGAVHSPGLVTLQGGDRVAHAVVAAGGALAVADLSALNLAAPVGDGDQVTVPAKGETAPMRINPGNVRDDGLVDVNYASAADLEALPGVGPVLADRIFEYREEHGPFNTVEDLLDVPGIGEGKLAALREALVLR